VGEPMVGIYNGSHWSADLSNAANEAFVADFQKTYGRHPTLYAAQAYDTARLIDSAVAAVGGRVEDRDAFRAALRKADFKSVRGGFRFNNNQFPIHTLYIRTVQKDASGRIGNKLVGKTLVDHKDSFAATCPMK
jgi:branched-chain amino acid transport system substrate-binding protein